MFEDQTKLHESALDRARQTEIMLRFCRTWGFSALQSSGQCRWDLLLIEDTTPIALADIKWRDHPWGTYRTYTIDADKVDLIVAEARRRKLSPLLIVSWQGEIRFTHLKPPYLVGNQKRADRDELSDRVYHIPIGDFH
jgi:hypothetical protein